MKDFLFTIMFCMIPMILTVYIVFIGYPPLWFGILGLILLGAIFLKEVAYGKSCK